MKFAELIQNFPYALKTEPQKFNIEDLQDLDRILADLDREPDEVIQKVKNWFMSHTNARDDIIRIASPTRQVNVLPRQAPSREATIIQNLFELRETNREVLRQNNQEPPKSDDRQ
ncbi:hypothetical protein F7734_05475 [Scytonema sp. UIC 10036]|uniref:hypothetical protein n=1 Tax=Scytonema sp. UIC 10036 TaxID=2304196 RepID=UPI0012DAEC60|nr:hypothetical protein [Scytonema sp. UIC 10036]MUG91940.1 hypothetical protein [Scytonema sp. UIC 10036]